MEYQVQQIEINDEWYDFNWSKEGKPFSSRPTSGFKSKFIHRDMDKFTPNWAQNPELAYEDRCVEYQLIGYVTVGKVRFSLYWGGNGELFTLSVKIRKEWIVVEDGVCKIGHDIYPDTKEGVLSMYCVFCTLGFGDVGDDYFEGNPVMACINNGGKYVPDLEELSLFANDFNESFESGDKKKMKKAYLWKKAKLA